MAIEHNPFINMRPQDRVFMASVSAELAAFSNGRSETPLDDRLPFVRPNSLELHPPEAQPRLLYHEDFKYRDIGKDFSKYEIKGGNVAIVLLNKPFGSYVGVQLNDAYTFGSFRDLAFQQAPKILSNEEERVPSVSQLQLGTTVDIVSTKTDPATNQPKLTELHLLDPGDLATFDQIMDAPSDVFSAHAKVATMREGKPFYYQLYMIDRDNTDKRFQWEIQLGIHRTKRWDIRTMSWILSLAPYDGTGAKPIEQAANATDLINSLVERNFSQDPPMRRAA